MCMYDFTLPRCPASSYIVMKIHTDAGVWRCDLFRRGRVPGERGPTRRFPVLSSKNMNGVVQFLFMKSPPDDRVRSERCYQSCRPHPRPLLPDPSSLPRLSLDASLHPFPRRSLSAIFSCGSSAILRCLLAASLILRDWRQQRRKGSFERRMSEAFTGGSCSAASAFPREVVVTTSLFVMAGAPAAGPLGDLPIFRS